MMFAMFVPVLFMFVVLSFGVKVYLNRPRLQTITYSCWMCGKASLVAQSTAKDLSKIRCIKCRCAK